MFSKFARRSARDVPGRTTACENRPWNLLSGRKGGADDRHFDHRSRRDNRHGYYQHPRKAALTVQKSGVGKPAPDTSPSIQPIHPTETKGFPNTSTFGD